MNLPIYETPELTSDDLAVLDLINEQLGHIHGAYLRTPRRWFGSLRRSLRASSVRGSNAIEGYIASEEDVAAILDGEEPSAAVTAATRQAVEGYQLAMDFVVQLAGARTAQGSAGIGENDAAADDGSATGVALLSPERLQSLHFMLMQHDFASRPGLWRLGDVWVKDESGVPLYQAPDVELVEPLLIEMCEQVRTNEAPRLVAAAMAHLNLAMIHPFVDGNGRMARIAQSLVLVDGGLSVPAANAGPQSQPQPDVPLTPDFGNIEECLWLNQAGYYAVLDKMSDGTWSPQRSARPWLEFILTAHYQQALALVNRIAKIEAMWDRCEQMVSSYGLPDRAVACLNDAARGWRLTRALYIKRTEHTTRETKENPLGKASLSEGMASRDLAAMLKAGLLTAVGDKRGRTYLPSGELSGVWQQIELDFHARPKRDPYELVRSG